MQTIKTCPNPPALGVAFNIGDRKYTITKDDAVYVIWSSGRDGAMYFSESLSGMKSLEEFCLKSQIISNSHYVIRQEVYEHGDRFEIKGKVTGQLQHCSVVKPNPNGIDCYLIMDNGYIYTQTHFDSQNMRKIFSEEAYEIRLL